MLRAAGSARISASSTANSFAESSQRSSVPGGGPAERVELDAGGSEDAGLSGGPASGERADPQDQLGEVERLGEVVVGAEPEPARPAPRGVGRGEHEHHGRVLAAR